MNNIKKLKKDIKRLEKQKMNNLKENEWLHYKLLNATTDLKKAMIKMQINANDQLNILIDQSLERFYWILDLYEKGKENEK